MDIAKQTVDSEDIIKKVLTKIYGEEYTFDIKTYNELCTIIEETLICLKDEK